MFKYRTHTRRLDFKTDRCPFVFGEESYNMVISRNGEERALFIMNTRQKLTKILTYTVKQITFLGKLFWKQVFYSTFTLYYK